MDAFAFNILLISTLAFIIIIILLFALNGSKSYNLLTQMRLLLVIFSSLIPKLDANVHDTVAESLERSKQHTIHIHQYSWLIGTEYMLTSYPANVQHVTSTNVSNYPKGSKLIEELDFLGHNLLTSDFEEGEMERKFIRSFTSHHNFHHTMTKIVWHRIQTGLIPVLQRISDQGLVFDLQALFQKHILGIAWKMTTGYNPNSLGNDFRKDPLSEAFEDACEAAFSRHLMPHSLWKLQRWLGIGKENKRKHACETIDRVFAECIYKKQLSSSKEVRDREGFDFRGFYYRTRDDDKGSRDHVIGLIFATQDTTSTVLTWFFWSVAKHPSVEAKIRDEIPENFQGQELDKLVYLHAALCETVRLFPPGAVLSRITVQPDTLPSGHRIDRNTNVVIAVHAMGRMTSVWGDDCHEFKPERWINEQGEIKHVPHYHFSAFSAGPRICLGKDFAFTLMKAIAATIIYNYNIQILKDHLLSPRVALSST